MDVHLGDTVKDDVSGFQGIVVSRLQQFRGSTRVEIQPSITEDGKLPKSEWFDTERITQ